MLHSFFQAICRVGIFMICAQAIVHFRPQEVYEKYLKLLVSVMVLIQLFLPLGGFLLRGGGEETVKLLEQFGMELEQSMEDAARNAAAVDAVLEQMTLEEVMRQMEIQQRENQQNRQGQEIGEENAETGGTDSGIKVEIENIEPVNVGSPEKAE